MKTKSGYETNGDYIKFKSGYTQSWIVETSDSSFMFDSEYKADMHIIKDILGCEKGYVQCIHYKAQQEGCNNCKNGFNKNCANHLTKGTKCVMT